MVPSAAQASPRGSTTSVTSTGMPPVIGMRRRAPFEKNASSVLSGENVGWMALSVLESGNDSSPLSDRRYSRRPFSSAPM